MNEFYKLPLTNAQFKHISKPNAELFFISNEQLDAIWWKKGDYYNERTGISSATFLSVSEKNTAYRNARTIVSPFRIGDLIMVRDDALIKITQIRIERIQDLFAQKDPDPNDFLVNINYEDNPLVWVIKFKIIKFTKLPRNGEDVVFYLHEGK